MKGESIGKGRPVLVVGAGFSGLAAAHYLVRSGFDVEVREATARPGGLIATRETPFGPVETAANGLLNSARVEDFFTDVGVEMRGTLATARSRYIFRHGRPRRWPLTIGESLRMGATLLGDSVRVFFSGGFQGLAPRSGESIRAWGTRVLSADASRYTLETALQGIYAGDPARMSATLALGHLFASTKGGRSAETRRSRAKRQLKFRGTVSPVGGMERLIEGVRASIENRGARVELQSPVRSDDLSGSRRPIVIAAGLEASREILQSLDAERAEALRTVKMLPIVSVGAHFPLNASSGPPPGFGCLFPPGEARALGVLWNNSIFGRSSSSLTRASGDEPQPEPIASFASGESSEEAQEILSETWILGGALSQSDGEASIVDLDDEEILERVRQERARIVGADIAPVHARITRRPKALPHMTVDVEAAASRFRPNRGNLFLLGNFTGGIGLAKILEQAEGLPEEIDRIGVWT